MTTTYLWTIILGGLVVTYLIRLSFILLIPLDRFPERFRRGLRFVPPAVLAALITPELLRPGGAWDLSLGNGRLLAGLAAILVAWRTKNTWLTILVGMVVLWLLSQTQANLH
jgi:branched-subunit amino acid transport protein